ncbi:MAG: sugar phosphate isomerase/epimerase [Planctomycetes bacterium]|nr:sugar phosphate isomerase/epimerase [Planctomycetota bacterium]
MFIGLCGTASTNARAIAPSALDYVEENVQSFLAPEAGEDDFRARIGPSSLAARPIAAACCFLPATLRCVGPAVDDPRIDAYAASTFRRAATVGISTIVFGSGGARSLPEGWPRASAEQQFVALLRRLAPMAQRHGVTIVVEPLNRGECSFINTLDEGAEVVRAVDHPAVRLLVDLFHLARNDEAPETIARNGALLAHAHLAEREERSAPGVKGDDFRPFLSALRSTGYDHRLSLECGFGDLAAELGPALKALRAQLSDVGY